MSWKMQSIQPLVVIFGNESGSISLCEETNVIHQPFCKSGSHGTVLLGSMFRQVEQLYPLMDVYGFVNADIVFANALHAVLDIVRIQLQTSFLLIGAHRTLNITTRMNFTDDEIANWSDTLIHLLRESNVPFDRVDAVDYFIWTNGFFNSTRIPDFHVGRPVYDNWLVNMAIHSGKPVVDVSNVLPALHQAHDYSHLPTGAYRDTDEHTENIQLALRFGGWQFGTIEHATHQFIGHQCTLETISTQCKLTAKRKDRRLQQKKVIPD
jgi:hypothetical protein